MILLDSNIIIYSTQNLHFELRKWLRGKELAVSIISKIEVLGYSHISTFEIEKAEYYFHLCRLYKLDDAIAFKAIEIRQHKKMGLGDAIIAATALEYELTLATANTKDFGHLKDLDLINPLI